MKIQLLISTVDANDYILLLDRINVQSDAIIVNQCNRNSVISLDYKGNNITIYECAERGVGKSRNIALMRSDADYCIFTDDDMVYEDNYVDIVTDEIEKNSKADVILFNLVNNGLEHMKKRCRVRWYNYMRFGAAGMCVKRERIFKNSIFFNLCFGGGAKYSCGEDTLFLTECLRKKLKIIFTPKTIAKLDTNSESTWFKGINEKFFFDKGVLAGAITSKFHYILCAILLKKRIRSAKKMGVLKTYKLMIDGIREFKK